MRACSICGKENPDDGRFCSFCGKALGPADKEAAVTADQASENAKKIILYSIGSRGKTDRRISPAWSAVTLLLVLPTAGIYWSSIVAILLSLNFGGEDGLFEFYYVYGRNLLTIAFGALFALLVFKMLSRMNAHIEREERLRRGVMSYLMASSRGLSSEPGMMKELIAASAYDGQALVYEKKMPAKKWAYQFALVFMIGSLLTIAEGLWLFDAGGLFERFALFALMAIVTYLVIIIGLVMLLMFASNLMKTMYTHEVRWIGFVNSTGVALRRLGKRFDPSAQATAMKERSMMLYAVLTVITFGLFGIYWLYVLIDDPNKHFVRQEAVEDALKKALQ